VAVRACRPTTAGRASQPKPHPGDHGQRNCREILEVHYCTVPLADAISSAKWANGRRSRNLVAAAVLCVDRREAQRAIDQRFEHLASRPREQSRSDESHTRSRVGFGAQMVLLLRLLVFLIDEVETENWRIGGESIATRRAWG
jgi:hypothetical protein